MAKKSTFTRKNSNNKIESSMQWAICIVVTLILFFWKSFPLFNQWQEQRSLLAQYSVSIPQMEEELKTKELELIEVENEYKVLSSPFTIRESQMYPDHIDIKKISKIIELYSLQMSLVENVPFEVEKLSFGGASKVEGKRYFKTSIDINFVANERLVKDFVYFLQTGQLTKKFEAARNSGQLDPRAYTFLKENILPIAQLDSIKIVDKEDDGSAGQVSANIQFYLFSQKTN